MKKGRKITYAVVAVALGLSLMLPTSAANSINDAKDKKDEIEGQIDQVEKQVKELKEKSSSTQNYIDKLDEQLATLSSKLVKVEQDLAASEQELTATQTALEEAKLKKDKQYEDMKKRIKFMYENGETAYLEMILNAENFADMLNKADYVREISTYDRNMMTQFQNTVKDIADKEAAIQQKCTEIEELKKDVERQKTSVESLTETKKEEMSNYKKELAASEEKKQQYEEELDEQEDLIAALEAEAARKAAEEAKRKEAERKEAERKEAERKEAERKAAEANAKSSSSATSKPNTSSNDEPSKTPNASSAPVSSSGWVWPCPGHTTINSDYGYRSHPITGTNKMHNGIDIKASTGTPIVAAKSGTVIAASYSSSMGNFVMIDHGGGITTIYMHCSALATSSGKSVNAGQTIAYVGSTGQSTGPHLHFSVRLNSVYVNPWNYVGK